MSVGLEERVKVFMLYADDGWTHRQMNLNVCHPEDKRLHIV